MNNKQKSKIISIVYTKNIFLQVLKDFLSFLEKTIAPLDFGCYFSYTRGSFYILSINIHV